MDAPWWIVAALVLVAAVLAVSLVERRTVYEYQHALRYRDGRLRGTMSAGRYWLWRTRDTLIVHDARPMLHTVPGQEVLSSDGVPLKLSLAARFEIADPVVALHEHATAIDELYVTLQLALRRAVSTRGIDELLEDRGAIAPELLEAAAPRAEELGLRLLAVDVKDLMLPGPVKDLFARVVQARKDGEASLEAVRAETAALRSLANAARLVQEHPDLLPLRALQAVAASSGNTIVVDTSGRGDVRVFPQPGGEASGSTGRGGDTR